MSWIRNKTCLKYVSIGCLSALQCTCFVVSISCTSILGKKCTLIYVLTDMKFIGTTFRLQKSNLVMTIEVKYDVDIFMMKKKYCKYMRFSYVSQYTFMNALTRFFFFFFSKKGFWKTKQSIFSHSVNHLNKLFFNEKWTVNILI